MSIRNPDAIPSAYGEFELTALRLELDRARKTLEEDDNELEVDGATAAGDEADAASSDDSNFSDDTSFRVLAFGGGIYRGQARLQGRSEQNEWEPHGLGVLTTSSGHMYCGQWLNGNQAGHGTRYDPALHYEGDVGAAGSSGTLSVAATTCRTRHGVGLYTLGLSSSDAGVGCYLCIAWYPPSTGSR